MRIGAWGARRVACGSRELGSLVLPRMIIGSLVLLAMMKTRLLEVGKVVSIARIIRA
jgi:hypothetical protein